MLGVLCTGLALAPLASGQLPSLMPHDNSTRRYAMPAWDHPNGSVSAARRLGAAAKKGAPRGSGARGASGGPPWLAGELDAIRNEAAFGLFSPASTAPTEVRLGLIAAWWVEGLSGCLFRSEASLPTSTGALLAFGGLKGLEECVYPHELVSRCPWFLATPSTGFALMPLLLFAQFPRRRWYVLGDDVTIFNPLALAQWLTNFDPREAWYLGGRSENLSSRKALGWDMPAGGAGVVLSGSLLGESAAGLARCLDEVPWAQAPGGAWALHRCLGRLGVPLTASGGFHAMYGSSDTIVSYEQPFASCGSRYRVESNAIDDSKR